MRRLALLDLDGTLTDPREGIVACLRHAFAAVDRDPPGRDELLTWIGPPLTESFTRAFPGDPPRAAAALSAYRSRFDRRGWCENRPVEGIHDALGALRAAGFELVVATSKLERFARRIVDHFGFGDQLSAVFGSRQDGSLGAKVELITHVLTELGEAPAAALMVGDRHHDIDGATAAGIPAVGVLWGFGDRSELEAAGAAAIVATPMLLVDACTDLA